MSTTANIISGELNDGLRVDVQSFASLWTALRNNYEGTNVTKTIAQCLNMYKSKDGIKAYEKLLKILCTILKDFDENGRRLLVSMVPLPKGSSDEDIKNVFFSSTGFSRLNAPSYQSSDLQESSTNQTMPSQDVNQFCNFLSPSSSSDPSDSSHQQKVQRSNYVLQNNNPQMFNSHQHFNDHQQDAINIQAGYKLNRHQSSPYLMQHSGYGDYIVKTLDNKFIRVPSTNMHYYRSYQMLQQQQQLQLQQQHQSMMNEKNHPSINNSTLKSQLFDNDNKIESIIDDKKIDLNNKNIDDKINNENKSNSSMIDTNKCIKNNFKITKNLTACIDRFLERAKNNNDVSSIKNINSSISKKRKTTELKNQTVFSMQPNVNDIAAYKKQYYDNLMSIQQAKLAKDFNPYHRSAEYLQQQQHHQQQQQQQQQQQWYYQQHQQQQRMTMGMGSQYPQRLLQPEYQYRTNEWMNVYGGVRYHSGMYDPACMMYPRQDATLNIYRNKPDEHHDAKRHKIDEITTKRKEHE